MRLSKYHKYAFHSKHRKIEYIIISRVAGAFDYPKGNTLSWKKLLGLSKAVFSLWFSAISTCQQPQRRSNDEKHVEKWSVSRASSMRCIGYTSFCMTLLCRRQQMQNRSEPSFFQTKSTGLDQGLDVSRATPLICISLTCSCITFRSAFETRNGRWRSIPASPLSIRCFSSFDFPSPDDEA